MNFKYWLQKLSKLLFTELIIINGVTLKPGTQL